MAIDLPGLFYAQGVDHVTVILALSPGSIFYMLFYDMVHKTHKARKCLSPFGSVLGFIVAFAFVILFE